MASKTYIDSDGLARFLSDLKSAYSTGKSGFTVKYATHASGDPKTIQETYLTIANAGQTYVPLTRTIAGVSLENNISKDSLLTALGNNVEGAMEAGAQVNVLEGISFKGNGDSDFADLTITNKKAILDLSGYALKSEVAKVMDFKGSATAAELAAIKAGTITADMNGDVYTVTGSDSADYKSGFEYVAVVSDNAGTLTLDWVELGKNFTGMASESWVTSGFVSKTAHQADLADVQSNIDTIYKAGTPAHGEPGDEGYTPAVPESGVLVTKIAAEALRASNAESALDARLDTLEGDASTAGSVAKAIADAIGGLDVSEVGGSGYVLTTISETDGEISATAVQVATSIGDNPSTTVPVTPSAVKTYVDSKVGDGLDSLDLADVGAVGGYVQVVGQSNGQLSATAGTFDTTIGATSGEGAATNNTAPTSLAVRTLVDSVTVHDAVSGGNIITSMVPMSSNAIDALFPAS